MEAAVVAYIVLFFVLPVLGVVFGIGLCMFLVVRAVFGALVRGTVAAVRSAVPR